MARSVRVQYEGARYHVINRGNYRKDLFSVHKTAEAFEKALFETCDRYEWWLHAYVIMSNHYHLCVETPNANLVDGMHWLQSSFSNRFSRFSGERGHVFQGRYKSLLIEDGSGLLNVVDYIHLNPVRKGLLEVDDLKHFHNSSFPKFCKKRRQRCLRCEDFLHEAGGLKPGLSGMRRYKSRLELIMAESPEEREKLFKDLCKGWYIGTRSGKQHLSEKIQNGEAHANEEVLKELEEQKSENLLSRGLKALGKSPEDILTEKKSADWKLALADWLKSRTSLKNREISDSLNMGHPATMSNHVTAYRRESRKHSADSKRLAKIL